MSKELLFQKKFNKSFWYHGCAIENSVADRLRPLLASMTANEDVRITLYYKGEAYDLNLVNCAKNLQSRDGHCDMWQIRWAGSRIKDRIHESFPLISPFYAGVEAVYGGSEVDEEMGARGEPNPTSDTKRRVKPKLPDRYAVSLKFYFDSEHPNIWYLEQDSVGNLNEQPQSDICDEPLQKIVQGAPGTGKSHLLKLKTQGRETIRTTFHPDSDYSTFVGSFRPDKARDSGRITYGFVPQAFTEAYVLAWKKRAQGRDPVFLIIEEINRGNCAQIFGDLFQLLDRRDDGFSCYPIRPNSSLRRYLAEDAEAFKNLVFDAEFRRAIVSSYSSESPDVVADVLSGRLLVLPDNLYIWATMNTSDQSLFPIDSAFKRRWEWQYVPIQDERREIKIVIGNDYHDWWSFLEKINAVIGSATHSEDKKLGYYFVKAKEGVVDVDRFVGKVIFYLWNDVFRNYGFDDKCFKVKEGDGEKVLSIQDFFLKDGKVNVDNIRTFLENLGVETIST